MFFVRALRFWNALEINYYYYYYYYRFACNYNVKRPKLNTTFYQPGLECQCLYTRLGQRQQLALPPAVCITCKVCNTKGTPVVPLWRFAYFWPCLCFDGLHWNGFVYDWAILPDLANTFVSGKAKNSIFGHGFL